MSAVLDAPDQRVDLATLYAESNIADVIGALDRELIGLVPVKTRIREIAALLLVEAARWSMGIQADPPPCT